jgi:MFS transporter, DHA2 family, multidrug resistance protein
VFAQESLHYTATLSGIVLMPRTLAMMAVSPIVGRIYNHVQPRIVVGIGVLLFALGSYQLSEITLETGARDLIIPLVVTGAAFACLFVPLTTAALSSVARHEMADAAGLNSFVRQIGGSIGLTIFATMFTNYAVEGAHGIAPHLTLLRPEVATRVHQIAGALMARGMDSTAANMLAPRFLFGSMYQQATVLSFDKIFVLQGVLFLVVIPILYFLKVKRTDGPAEKVHIDLE